jgi:transcriptional regulator ATRX
MELRGSDLHHVLAPAVHNAQAIARIFRFGQTRPSFVYRMLYNATFEFRLYRRNLDKEGLFG